MRRDEGPSAEGAGPRELAGADRQLGAHAVRVPIGDASGRAAAHQRATDPRAYELAKAGVIRVRSRARVGSAVEAPHPEAHELAADEVGRACIASRA